MWLFQDIITSAKSTNVSWKYYFLITGKMSSQAGFGPGPWFGDTWYTGISKLETFPIKTLSVSLSVMESRDFFQVSVSNVSVSKDFGLGLVLLVSRLCMSHFLWSLARSSSLKTDLWSICSKFNCSKQSVSKLSLLLCEGAKTETPNSCEWSV